MQVALGQIQASRTAGRLRGMMTALPDHVLADLLSKLSAASMSAELLRVLKAMQTDGRRMPSMQPDSSGHTFLTTWLGSRHLSAVASGFEGLTRLALSACAINRHVMPVEKLFDSQHGLQF